VVAGGAEEFLGRLRLGRQLTTTGRVAAGGLIIAMGLLFALGGPGLQLAGSGAGGAALLAAFLIGLTLLNLMEMLGGSGDRGSTQVLIYETLEAPGGFLAGWSLVMGTILLTVLFCRAAAAHLLSLFPGTENYAGYVACGVLGLIVLIQLFQFRPRGEWLWPVALVLLALIVIALLAVLPSFSSADFSTLPHASGADFFHVAAWLCLCYMGLEVVLTGRRQMSDPGRLLPRALGAVLIAGALLIAAGLTIAAGLPLPAGATTEIAFAASFSSQPAFALAITVLAVVALMLAAGMSLTAGARQLDNLSRQGGLPETLRRVWRRFHVPPLLFVVPLGIGVPLSLLLPMNWLANAGAGLLLVVICLFNIACIHSRRVEPERRRTFLLPFFPLVPGVALGVGIGLLFSLPALGLLAIAGWMLVGVVVYFAYARPRMMVAQEGILKFSREPLHEKIAGVPRILVPLSEGREKRLMLELSSALAKQMGAEVVALQVIPMADPLAIEEGRRLAKERNTLFQWSTRVMAGSGVTTIPLTRLARSVQEGIVDTVVEEACDLIVMSWPLQAASPGVRMGRVLDPVVRDAPCDVAVVAYHSERLQEVEKSLAETGTGPEAAESLPIRRILVPTAGGPHAPLAARLAVMLSHEYDAEPRAIYVARPGASEEELAQANACVQQAIEEMEKIAAAQHPEEQVKGGQQRVHAQGEVVFSESIVEGIAQAASQSDLVLLGASEESLIDQVLFGTLPEEVARKSEAPVVMVKRYRGLRHFWVRRLWEALSQSLPNVTRQEQIDIYVQVRRKARPDIDFFIMVALSAVIATYGLLQGSAAVIIGAMLVAPLFTPILALSLGVVEGDIILLRTATEAALKGIAIAIGLAVMLTAISPLHNMTGEIMARTEPHLFDLAVALASGAAGAYAIARKEVAAALPGVAIAAALVPPLCTVGIGLAMGDATTAGGGALLFTTNLIAIVLAGAVTLLLLGFRPGRQRERARRLQLGLVISVVSLIIITIPLAFLFVGAVQESHTRSVIGEVLTQQLDTAAGFEVVNFDFTQKGGTVDVQATVYARQDVTEGMVQDLRDQLSQALARTVELHFVAIPVQEFDAAPK
jgi:uncharacterized hydrophobic protein (TIGR00271 family)